MATYEAETYTRKNGSNMDKVEYECATVEEVAADLRASYGDWDYAIVTNVATGEDSVIER